VEDDDNIIALVVVRNDASSVVVKVGLIGHRLSPETSKKNLKFDFLSWNLGAFAKVKLPPGQFSPELFNIHFLPTLSWLR
jgi:hypothetical protein